MKRGEVHCTEEAAGGGAAVHLPSDGCMLEVM